MNVTSSSRPRRPNPFLASLALAILVMASHSVFSASPSFTEEFPFIPENGSDSRRILTKVLSDLRVFVDLDSLHMPRNEKDGDLKAEEVREAVTLGIGNWAGIMPGFRFRLVESIAEANLVIRFRAFGFHISGNATAESFLPYMWKSDPGSYHLDCGAKEFGKLPSGEPCRETMNNIILFQLQGMAFRRVHFLDSRMYYEFLAAKSVRSDLSKRVFRILPDPHYQTWPPDRATCIDGAPRAGVYPVWDIQCVEDSVWAALPHYREFGRYSGAYDIASLVGHEFGHTLLGGHTAESGSCPTIPGEKYENFSRNPVYLKDRAIRKAVWSGGSSYSALFTGNGLDAAWNIRGIFDIDAIRLAGVSFGDGCKPQIGGAFPTTYPKVNGWIVLQKPDGSVKYVNDWRYAHRLMAWPLSRGRAVESGWFQTGILLR